MRMGNMAMSGRYGPTNLSHVLLDNEVHDSTGAQATLSASVDFAAVAVACAYGEVWRAAEVNTLGQFLARPRQSGAGFIHLKTAPGSLPDLPRPHITPPAAMARLTYRDATAADLPSASRDEPYPAAQSGPRDAESAGQGGLVTTRSLPSRN